MLPRATVPLRSPVRALPHGPGVVERWSFGGNVVCTKVSAGVWPPIGGRSEQNLNVDLGMSGGQRKPVHIEGGTGIAAESLREKQTFERVSRTENRPIKRRRQSWLSCGLVPIAGGPHEAPFASKSAAFATSFRVACYRIVLRRLALLIYRVDLAVKADGIL